VGLFERLDDFDGVRRVMENTTTPEPRICAHGPWHRAAHGACWASSDRS